MNKQQLNTVLGLGQRYINQIDLGCVYKVAVLTKTGCYRFKVRNNQSKLKKIALESFIGDLAAECLENWNTDFYYEVKETYQSLNDEEAIILVYGSDCGDLDHFYKGTVNELKNKVYEDFNEGE